MWNQHSTLGKDPMSLFLNHTMQFCKCFLIEIWIDCWALSQDVHKQNPFSVPKGHGPDFLRGNCWLEFFLCRWRSVSYLHAMDYCSDSEVMCDNHVLTPPPMTAPSHCFNLSCKHFWNPECTEFLVVYFFRPISWRAEHETFWEWCHCESSVLFSSTGYIMSLFA